MTNRIKLFFSSLLLAIPLTLFGSQTTIDDFVEKQTKNNTFYGMASYYNNVYYYIVDNEHISKISGDAILQDSQYLAVVGRFQVMLIQKSDLIVKIKNENLVIVNPKILKYAKIKIVKKNKLSSVSPELDQLRYYHLWAPLAWLSKLIEFFLVLIQTYIVSSWGVTVIVFASLCKLVLLPVGIMTTKFQRRVSQVQSSLIPKLAEIKTNFHGEEAHNHVLAAHKELGISPFYTLKPFIASFIQIPILIATFNTLGEMPQFAGQSFLWINDLAYPDAIMQSSFTVIGFGSSINMLPLLMTIITICLAIFFQNVHAPVSEVKKQKRNLYFMALAFFILFYPFPAVMVLYWVSTNFLQIIQQKCVRI